MNDLKYDHLPSTLIKRGLILIFFYIFIIPTTFTQVNFGSNPEIIDKIRGDIIAIDVLGNLYIVQESSLYKYSLKGELLYSYSNFSLGPISSVDVTNPMKIMLFYKDAATLLFLDDRLSPISENLDLMNKQLATISLAAYSTNNQIWLYDFINMDLITLDMYFNVTGKVHYNFPNFQPTQLMEIPGKMFAMYNPEQGIYLFDSFGSYIKTIGIQTEKKVQFVGQTLIYLKDSRLHIYNYQELRDESFELKDTHIKQSLKFRDKYILLKESGEVEIY